MLNLFQHLVLSMVYETLKQVQGDSMAMIQRSQTIEYFDTKERRIVSEVRKQ